MKTLTIRQVPHNVHEALRIKAAEHGHSMEEEVRRVIEAHVGAPGPRRRARSGAASEGLMDKARSWDARKNTPADRQASVERLHAFVRKLWGGALPGDVVDRFLDEKREETARENQKDGV